MQTWSPTDIMRESSNVGTIMIAQQLNAAGQGPQRLDAALRSFGLGEKTSVDFPGQAQGLLLKPTEYYATGMAAVPIGYGVAVSAQQMLDVYTTIANGGVTVPPQLVQATIDAQGNQHPRPAPPGHRVVSSATARTVTDMLTQVVSGGTGACGAIPGYTVAGKTGTSRKPLNTGGYSKQTMASFIGFAPAEAPRVATIVVLDSPQGAQIYGGRAAAPVFAEITGSALRTLRVPPPDANSTQYAQAQATARADNADCSVPHGEALTRSIAQRAQQAQAAEVHALAAPAGTGAGTAAGTAKRGGRPTTSTLPATSAHQ
jgi:cell division protein FtsI (penicillin-binding protein 3)